MISLIAPFGTNGLKCVKTISTFLSFVYSAFSSKNLRIGEEILKTQIGETMIIFE